MTAMPAFMSVAPRPKTRPPSIVAPTWPWSGTVSRWPTSRVAPLSRLAHDQRVGHGKRWKPREPVSDRVTELCFASGDGGDVDRASEGSRPGRSQLDTEVTQIGVEGRLLARSLSVRFPMIRAHTRSYVPLGKSLGRVPGTTTEPAGTRPRCSTGSGPVTSMIGVEAVSTVLAPSTAPSSTSSPSTTIDLLPMNAPSSMITGLAPGGSRTPPMPTPPERWTSRPIWAHDPTVAQVSTMVPAPT